MATKIAALRGRVMKRLVDEVTTAFAKYQYEILTGQLQGSFYNIVHLILNNRYSNCQESCQRSDF